MQRGTLLHRRLRAAGVRDHRRRDQRPEQPHHAAARRSTPASRSSSSPARPAPRSPASEGEYLMRAEFLSTGTSVTGVQFARSHDSRRRSNHQRADQLGGRDAQRRQHGADTGRPTPSPGPATTAHRHTITRSTRRARPCSSSVSGGDRARPRAGRQSLTGTLNGSNGASGSSITFTRLNTTNVGTDLGGLVRRVLLPLQHRERSCSRHAVHGGRLDGRPDRHDQLVEREHRHPPGRHLVGHGDAHQRHDLHGGPDASEGSWWPTAAASPPTRAISRARA